MWNSGTDYYIWKPHWQEYAFSELGVCRLVRNNVATQRLHSDKAPVLFPVSGSVPNNLHLVRVSLC